MPQPATTDLSSRSAKREGGLSRVALIRYWATRTFSGRAVVYGTSAKVVAFVMALIFGASRWFELLDTVGDLAIIVGTLIVGLRLFVKMKAAMLWRVRSKLTLSYIFMGFVPALLIIVFFMVAGLLLFLNIGAYMMRTDLSRVSDSARFAAESAALGVAREISAPRIHESLQVRRAVLASRYPDTSVTLLPAPGRCGRDDVDASVTGERPVIGPWKHLAAPTTVPAWIQCSGFGGLIVYNDRGGTMRVVARGVAWPKGGQQAVVVDVPIDAAFEREMLQRSGVIMGGLSDQNAQRSPVVGPSNLGIVGGAGKGRMNWIGEIESFKWESGERTALLASYSLSLIDVYNRLAVTEVSQFEKFDIGRALIFFLAIIGALFLIIQVVAFSMGLALARSITGSVHELFAGTERVRRGDFTGRVAIKSRDQMGELSTSFNSMTSSIEDLLQQKAEKERMEQELRIARNIQMSLLPQGPLLMPGISLTAHCEPAREVGGDYYDFLPIDDHTFGILVADVSGKGTSAALYMAELKGIMMSLSQRHRSPRELLIEADRIISRHLDSRSFITVTYVVVDLRAGLLQYARAGHCPLVYVPGPYAQRRKPQLMAPDGLVLGLTLDQGRTFNRLLEEVAIPLGRGDLIVLYTDGITEAMNGDGECFGDARLASLIGQHADLSADELRERILREIEAFVGSADQHDDMTMILMKVDRAVAERVAV